MIRDTLYDFVFGCSLYFILFTLKLFFSRQNNRIVPKIYYFILFYFYLQIKFNRLLYFGHFGDVELRLTVRCMAGGKCGLSAVQSWNDALRLWRETCRNNRRRRTITNATDAAAITVAAESAPTSKPITRRLPLPLLLSLPMMASSRFFVCCGKPVHTSRLK